MDPAKVILIYNGIDYKNFCAFQHQAPSNYTITYFGRIGVSKGIDILLEAINLFLEQNDHVYLKLIVPRNFKPGIKRLESFIKKNNFKQNVILLHNLPDEQLKKELCNSSCVVIPSYSEGFCFAAVEVIAMGIPVISSNKGALKEVISGTHMKLKELNVTYLLDALKKAKENEWTKSQIKYFHLSACVEHYNELYTG